MKAEKMFMVYAYAPINLRVIAKNEKDAANVAENWMENNKMRANLTTEDDQSVFLDDGCAWKLDAEHEPARLSKDSAGLDALRAEDAE